MEPQYFEIFHSKPSWGTSYVQRRDASGWATPTAADALVDATHIREQFRVFRGNLRDFKGGRLEFVLSNGGTREWEVPPDSPEGWFAIEGSGRYVIEHGCRRVGDVDFGECERAIKHKNDRHVTVDFVADLWEKCYLAYSADGKDWVTPPGVAMALVSKDPRKFSVTVPASLLVFAFNNGGEGDESFWDSNNGANFRVGLPGAYSITEGQVVYNDRSPKDKGTAADTSPASIAEPTVASSLKPIRGTTG